MYEYFRNADLNANNFFNNLLGAPGLKDNQNQYGVVLSGPIKKDKAFFFFSWEGFAKIIGESSPTNVPTQAMRNGVFTNPITDPLGNCNIVHNPNAGTWTITNLCQGACGDPLAHILMNYYPLPNTSGAFNWFLTTPITNHQNQYNGRVDYSYQPQTAALWPLHLLDSARYRVLGIQQCRRLADRQWPRHQPLAAGCAGRHLHL